MRTPLTSGRISGHLLRLTAPSVVGFLAITAFNLTDTYFVSRLGTAPLAAMGFTFPVVMVVGAIAMGVSMGAGSLLARAIGAGDEDGVRRAATHGILLAMAVTALVSATGLSTMDPLFRAMGATEETLPLVKRYMRVWYACGVVMVMPPVGDSNLRASGDMVRPSIVMLIVALSNVVMDPILIFGAGPIPAMGIAGAAWATVIARTLGMIATLTFNFRARLLGKVRIDFRGVMKTWGRILHIGIPTAIIQLLPSALRGVLTAMAATAAGTIGVAAIAAGSRVESVPLMVAWAFNYSVLTLIAQNYGAGRPDRVDAVRRATITAALIYGGILAVVMRIAAPALANIFSDVPAVIDLSAIYLRVVFTTSAGVLLLTWTSIAFNGIGRPLTALSLTAGATVLLMIPGAYLGRQFFPENPFRGMVIGLAVAYALTGFVAWFVGRRWLRAPEGIRTG